MSQLLDRAVEVVRGLPDSDQDAIAALILEEIEDDRRWDEAFAHTPGKLAALAARADEQVRADRRQTQGNTRLAGTKRVYTTFGRVYRYGVPAG